MKRILFLLFTLSLFACKKTEQSNTTPIVAPGNLFKSKAPIYSEINQTVGQIKNNHYFPGFYLTNDTIKSKYNLTINNSQYFMFENDYVYFDYNSDGKLDLFGFLMDFSTTVYGRNNGKFVLVDDVLSANAKKQYYSSTTRWAGRFEITDINGDKRPELILYSSDGHTLLDGSYGLESPLKIISFSGTEIQIKEIGVAMGIHDLASGDIDGDKDIDILVWSYNENVADGQPYLYLNDGLGNFTLTNNKERFTGLKEILDQHNSYVTTSIELFDLDNDGILDLITGQNIGQKKVNPWEDYRISSSRIYWGQKNGYFDLKNNHSDLPNSSISDFSKANSVLGFGFVDFDKDGDYDIVSSITRDYGGYILQLYENLGNKVFRDVTNSKINSFSNIFPRNNGKDGDFPNFYQPRIYDLNSDGYYDIIPQGVANWEGFKYVPNLNWENVSGTFVKRPN